MSVSVYCVCVCVIMRDLFTWLCVAFDDVHMLMAFRRCHCGNDQDCESCFGAEIWQFNIYFLGIKRITVIS